MKHIISSLIRSIKVKTVIIKIFIIIKTEMHILIKIPVILICHILISKLVKIMNLTKLLKNNQK